MKAALAWAGPALLAMGVLALPWTGAAGECVALRGEAMKAWLGHTCQCRDVRFEKGVVTGVVTGNDAQLYAKLPAPLMPKGNHVVYLKMKTPRGGRGQVFWMREGERGMADVSRQAGLDGDEAP